MSDEQSTQESPPQQKKPHGNTKHGSRKNPEYAIWNMMLQRIKNPNNKDYPNYGGRGLTVDDSWLSFPNFLADMGPRPSKLHSSERN
jgi:hypothetical protein